MQMVQEKVGVVQKGMNGLEQSVGARLNSMKDKVGGNISHL